MKKLIVGLLMLGLTIPSFAQVVDEGTLPEVVVRATNYKYLNSVGTADAPVNVKMLERQVANFDLKESEFYRDEYDFYQVYFYIPDGKIVAAYDKEGNLLRTIEKFKNVKVPKNVLNSVYERFPGWTIYSDVYKVNYHHQKGTKAEYKMKLQNGDKKMRVRTDGEGNFL
ncbi:MAG: nicotinate-nucleotide adenylyltransferase [Bacteroidota bacterium]